MDTANTEIWMDHTLFWREFVLCFSWNFLCAVCANHSSFYMEGAQQMCGDWMNRTPYPWWPAWMVINFTFHIRMLNPTRRNLKWASCSVFVIGLKQWSPDIDWDMLSHVVFPGYFLELHVILYYLKNTEHSIFTQEVGF